MESKEQKILNKKTKRKKLKKSLSLQKENLDNSKQKSKKKKQNSDKLKRNKNMDIDCYFGNDKLFIAKKVTNFSDIIKGWNSQIKSIKYESGEIISKLKNEELSLKECTDIAYHKLKNLESIDDAYLVLSYDNVNECILYYSLKRLKELGEEKIANYKYSFTDILELNEEGKIKSINLKQEFNYNFIYKDIIDIKNNMISILSSLTPLANDKNINNNLIFDLDDNGSIKIQKEKDNNDKINLNQIQLIQKLLYYKDFNVAFYNQPFSYRNNKALYMNYIIYKIYNSFIEYNSEEKKIKLLLEKFEIIKKSTQLIIYIIDELKSSVDLMNNQIFFIEIKFLLFLLELDEKNANYDEAVDDFCNHIFDLKNHFTKEDAEEIKKIKLNINKVEKSFCYKYEINEDFLKIEDKADNSIIFKYKNYPKVLKEKIIYNEKFLPLLWRNNSLQTFQEQNFLDEKDISFLKTILKEIFFSNFWNEIEKHFLDNEFTDNLFFKNDKVVDEFLEKIKFIPFNSEILKIYAYTFSEDLEIFVTGYPNCLNWDYFSNYKANKILTLSLSLIIALHESIHYAKRLLYFLTCGMVSRITLLDNNKKEGGYIFEKLVFGWGEGGSENNYFNNNKNFYAQKINLETALKLLNKNNYLSINKLKNILYNYESEKDFNQSLKDYLNQIGLKEEESVKDFINKNKKLNINASMNFNEIFIEYTQYSHLKILNK